MQSFRDTKGRTWEVAINVAATKRVRALVDVDLMALADSKLRPLGELLADPVKLCDVLYALCKDQADREQITDVDFGEAMAGDSLSDASDAFVEALADFFPNLKIRVLFRQAIAKGKEVQDLQIQTIEAKLEALDPAQLAAAVSANNASS